MREFYLFVCSHPFVCFGILIVLFILIAHFVEEPVISMAICSLITLFCVISIGFGSIELLQESENTCRKILITPVEETKETKVFYGTNVYSQNGAISFKDSAGTLHSLDMASFKDSTFSIEDVEKSYCE